MYMSSSEEHNKYNDSKIYALRSPSTPKYYIGSTTLKLKNRFSIHKYQYAQYVLNKFNYITSFEIIQYGDSYIELLENYNCDTITELHKREGSWIRSCMKLPICHLVNKKIDGRTPHEYLRDNLEKIKLYQKEYRHNNEVYYKEYMKNWLDEHPGYMKKYRNKIKNSYVNEIV